MGTEITMKKILLLTECHFIATIAFVHILHAFLVQGHDIGHTATCH